MSGPLCILGPTASGKSGVAMAVAERIEGIELVSIDSMQVYRGMNIGTAKPTAEEQARVPHHLIDIADPSEDFAVSRFQAAWLEVERDIANRGCTPVLVGGTGLYLRSVIDALELPGQYPEVRSELEIRATHELPLLYAELAELDALAASRIESNNERRIVRALEVTLGSGRPFSSFGPGMTAYPSTNFALLGLRVATDELDRRIDARYELQMEQGFLEEVQHLSDREPPMGRTARQALGYRELLRHVEEGELLEDVLTDALHRTHRFARRQMKWYRRDPRIEWVDVDAAGPVDHTGVIERAIEIARRSISRDG